MKIKDKLTKTNRNNKITHEQNKYLKNDTKINYFLSDF